MPFEAKFLNLSTDNYQCFLLNPSNYEIMESVELDETAIRKMYCPFEKLIVIMKNLTNPKEELLFDLPQCELYTIDKDFPQNFTIIKNDKQGKRFEGVPAPKDLKFSSNKDIKNSNQQVVQVNINKEANARDQIGASNLKGHYTSNNAYVKSEIFMPSYNSYYVNPNVERNYPSVQPINDFNSKPFSTNYNNYNSGVSYSYNQNVPLSNTILEDKSETNYHQKYYNPDRSFDLKNNQYSDLFKKENLYYSNLSSQCTSKSQIESTPEKYKSNFEDNKSTNNVIGSVLSSNNSIDVKAGEKNSEKIVSPKIEQSSNFIEEKKQSNNNSNQNFSDKQEIDDKTSSSLNKELQVKSENLPNPFVKSTEHSPGAYTLDTFDLNKFLKELNITIGDPHVEAKQNENLDISKNQINLSSDVKNNDKQIEIEHSALNNHSSIGENSDKTNKPLVKNESANTIIIDDVTKKLISEEVKKSDITENKENNTNLSKSAVVYIGADYKINDNEDKNSINNNNTSFNALESKNEKVKDLNKSAYLKGYDDTFEKYSVSRPNIFHLSSNKYYSAEEIKNTFDDSKKETNTQSNDSPLLTSYSLSKDLFPEKSCFQSKNAICASEANNYKEDKIKDSMQKNINCEKKEEKEVEEVKSEQKFSIKADCKDENSSTPLIVSTANTVVEEKKLPTTLIDFNIDDYLKNILKEYEPNFLNIPSPIPVETEIKENKVENVVHMIQEKPELSNENSEKQDQVTLLVCAENNPETSVKLQDTVSLIVKQDTEIVSPEINVKEDLNVSSASDENQKEEQIIPQEIKKEEEEEEEEESSKIEIQDCKKRLLNNPSIEKQDWSVSPKIESNNESFTFKKPEEMVPQQEKASKVSEFILTHNIIEFPPIEVILGSTNLNLDEIINPKIENQNNISQNSINLNSHLKEENKETSNVKSDLNYFNDISKIEHHTHTDNNLPTFTLKDIPTFDENNPQINFSFTNKKVEAANQDFRALNEELIVNDLSFNIPEEQAKPPESINREKKNISFEISLIEKSFEKGEENQITLDPNCFDKNNSFMIENISAKEPQIINRDSLLGKINAPEFEIKEKNEPKTEEFNFGDFNQKENLVFYPNEINNFYSSVKNFEKTLLGLIIRNNQYNENFELFCRHKNNNTISINNNSAKTLCVRLTGGNENIQILKPNTYISFMRQQGGIFKLQISPEAQLMRGPVFNVFSGCNYSIDQSLKLFDSNGEKVLLGYSKYPNTQEESSFNNVFFTFIECDNLINLNSLNNLNNEDFITFVNATSYIVSIRIKSDSINSNEDFYFVNPLMAVLIERQRYCECLTELKTSSQKIIKYNLKANNVYIFDEDHTLVKASNKEIVETTDQTIKFHSNNKSDTSLLLDTTNNPNNYSNIKLEGDSQILDEVEEDYFNFEQDVFDEDNLNEFNIDNTSAEELYLRIEKKTEGKDAFFLLKSRQDKWTIREDGLFLCEIVRTNLSSRRYLINTSCCYEIDEDLNLLESVTKRPIRRSYEKLPGNKLVYEGVYAQINYDLDFDFDPDAEYFQDIKPKYNKGRKFTDDSFPPKNYIISALNPHDKKRANAKNPHSLEKISDEVISSTTFKRPKEIFKGGKIFLFNDSEKKKVTETYCQSYVSSVLYTLNQNPSLVKHSFKTRDINKDGYYEIFYYEDGKKKVMFLDDYFPILSNDKYQVDSDKAYFSEPSFKNEIWLQLLEKAYAKYEGGYANITDGDVLSEIYFYTGAISYKFLTRDSAAPESVWENLLASAGGHTNNLVFAGFNDVEAKSVKNSKEPLTQFTYTVLACDEFDNGVETVRLIKMKNPAGPIDWLGEYAKGSEKWSNELKVYFESEKAYAQTGVFFLCFEEFVEQFDFYVVSFAS